MTLYNSIVQQLALLKRNSMFRNSFWAVLGNGIGYGVLLLSGILIARFLGKDLYGEYGVVKTTMFYIAAFSTFGLGYTSTKFVADYVANRKNEVDSVIYSSLLISLISSSILAILLFVFSAPLAKYLEEPSLRIAFQYLGIIIVFKAISTTQNGILAGVKSFKQIAINCILSGLLMLLTSVPFTLFWNLKGALLSLALSQFGNVIFNYYSLRKVRHNFILPVKKTCFKKLLVFSFPVALQELSYALCHWLTTLFLVKFSTLGEMGLYSASAQWNAIITFIPGLLYNVVLSYLSSSVKDKYSHKRTINQMIVVNLICTIIPFIFVAGGASWISSFYGDTFTNLPTVMRLLIFASIFTACSKVLQSEFISQGSTWKLFAIRVFRDMSLLLLVYILLNFHDGVNGAKDFAMSYVFSECIYFSLLFVVYKYVSSKKNR